MKALVLFYSLYGHVYELAKSIREGASSVPGCEVILRRVPETLSKEVLTKMGAPRSARKIAKEVPNAPSKNSLLPTLSSSGHRPALAICVAK